jgi:hypothetical protein
MLDFYLHSDTQEPGYLQDPSPCYSTLQYANINSIALVVLPRLPILALLAQAFLVYAVQIYYFRMAFK